MDLEELRYWMGTIYIILLVLWIVIVSMFKFVDLGLAGIMICAIPFIAYGVSLYFSDQCEQNNETPDTVVTGFLTFCLLIVAILSNWKTKKVEEKTIFFQIIVVGVILIMFSMIEIWVPAHYNPVMRYYRSGLRTLAFTLFILALYKYYHTSNVMSSHSHFIVPLDNE